MHLMWFKINSFLQFLQKSTNQHGIHSPFVYNLTINALYNKPLIKEFDKWKKLRKHLLNENKIIEVTDFGVGSKKMGHSRRVKDIAKIAGLSTKKAKILINLVSYLKPLNSLELGTSVGLGTAAIKYGNNQTHVTTLEGCTNTSQIAKYTFEKFGLQNITIIEGKFDTTLKNVLTNSFFDFIFFDGNHNKKATLKYFNKSLDSIKNESFFVFDDIYWSKEMKETWIEICNHPKVTVSIDLFYFGIVFFRKEQQKQHFTIRI